MLSQFILVVLTAFSFCSLLSFHHESNPHRHNWPFTRCWAANAHLPYLQSPESKFEIVAVCNSWVESATKSVRDLNLKGSVKTYGNVQGMSRPMNGFLLLCSEVP
jgi:hypothetical protein